MRIFVTHILPEKSIARYGLSYAGCNFSRNLISGGGFDKVYSTMPLFIKGTLDAEDPNYELIYSKLRMETKVLYKFATFAEQWSLYRHIPSHASIWLYNIGILNALLYVLLRLFKSSVKINIIELDFTPPTCKLSLMALFLRMLNKADGVIKLADSPLFSIKNSVCLPGVTPKSLMTPPEIMHRNLEFLLSGVLQPNISSIPMILDAFAKCPQCTLHITGQWNNMGLLDKYTSKYKNIIYHGILSHKDYMDLLHQVTFLLSLRNPDWTDNQCNFPSKIIEALLHNRIVISTIHYNQLDGIKYLETERSINGFIKTLTYISSLSQAEILSFANQGKVISQKCSTSIWNEWMQKIENNISK